METKEILADVQILKADAEQSLLASAKNRMMRILSSLEDKMIILNQDLQTNPIEYTSTLQAFFDIIYNVATVVDLENYDIRIRILYILELLLDKAEALRSSLLSYSSWPLPGEIHMLLQEINSEEE